MFIGVYLVASIAACVVFDKAVLYFFVKGVVRTIDDGSTTHFVPTMLKRFIYLFNNAVVFYENSLTCNDRFTIDFEFVINPFF